MQGGDPLKAVELIQRAIQLDETIPAACYAIWGPPCGPWGGSPRPKPFCTAPGDEPPVSQGSVQPWAGALGAGPGRRGNPLSARGPAPGARRRADDCALGYALGETGRTREALAVFGLGASPLLRVLRAIQLPLVYGSVEEVAQWRTRLVQEVDRLLAEGVSIDLTEELAFPVFSLAHQGLNDRDVQRRLVRLYRPPPDPVLAPTPRRSGQDRRIRVGFISHYFSSHTIGRLMRARSPIFRGRLRRGRNFVGPA